MGTPCLVGWCRPSQLNDKDILLEVCARYRQQLWHLPIRDVIRSVTLGDINPLRKVFFQEVIHYEDNDVNRSFSGSFTVNQFDSMQPMEKEHQLKELTKKCYMVIDEEELPFNQHRELMPRLTEETLFTESIVGDLSRSSLVVQDTEQRSRHRTSLLLKLDPEVIHKLRNFSDFCQQVRQQLQEQSSMLWRLMLNFKATMMSFERQSSNKVNASNEQFKEKYRISSLKFIQFFMEVLGCSYMLDKAAKNEGNTTFFTDQNVHTLVTSLFFEDPEFCKITTRVYEVALASVCSKFKARSYSFQKNHRTNLFSPVTERQDIHYNSLRMLDRVLTAPQPIIKLKVLHEVNLRIMKDVQKSRQGQSLVNAQQLLDLISQTMNRYQKQQLIPQVIITRDFIHQNYRMGKLGCVLAPFLATIGYC